MFGREAFLSVEISFGVTADDIPINSPASYAERLKRDLRQAYQAKQIAGQKTQHNKPVIVVKRSRFMIYNLIEFGKIDIEVDSKAALSCSIHYEALSRTLFINTFTMYNLD